MSLLSQGCKPPSFRMGKFDSWLRKAKLMKFHAALNGYEIQCSCGYTRYVKLGDMQQMVATSGNYKKCSSTLINQLVAFADGEFETSTGSSVGKIARASEILQLKRASLVIPETPACSQNVSRF